MKIGLVLGGGGAKGSYQIGVLKALMEYEITNLIDCVAGTSIGAMNAILLMSGMTYEEMIDLWDHIDNKKMYVDGYGRFKHDLKGIFSIREVYNLLVENHNIEDIHNSRMQGFAAVANIPDDKIISQLNRANMKLEIINLNTASDPYKVALASASIPVLFGPTQIDDTLYVDGGIIERFPVQALVDQACDLLITVSLYTKTHIDEYKDKVSIIDITPQFPLGIMPISSLDFSKKIAAKNLELGYNNTIEILNYIIENNLIDNFDKIKNKEPFFLNLKTVRKNKKAE